VVAAKANPAKKTTRTQAARRPKSPKPVEVEQVSDSPAVEQDSTADDYQPQLFEEQTPAKEPEPQEIQHFGPPKGLYPDDAELFSYTSKTTGETIWFPMKFEQPRFSQVWETYDKPWHVQTWEYMRWANIPKAMQRKAAQLFDVAPDEYLDLFNSWMTAVGGTTLGE
jgi:hypothetical protein